MSTRNQPCPCGSGKKQKRCCDSAQQKAEAYYSEKAAFLERLKQREQERIEVARERRRQRVGMSVPLMALALMAPLAYSRK